MLPLSTRCAIIGLAALAEGGAPIAADEEAEKPKDLPGDVHDPAIGSRTIGGKVTAAIREAHGEEKQ